MTDEELKVLLKVRFELNRYLLFKQGRIPLETSVDDTDNLIRKLDALIVEHGRKIQRLSGLSSEHGI